MSERAPILSCRPPLGFTVQCNQSGAASHMTLMETQRTTGPCWPKIPRRGVLDQPVLQAQ
jgi:hypothetical protein